MDKTLREHLVEITKGSAEDNDLNGLSSPSISKECAYILDGFRQFDETVTNILEAQGIKSTGWSKDTFVLYPGEKITLA